MTMLQLDDVSAGYGGGTALHHIRLDVPAGSVHAVLGHNGAGKTTLVHTIAGLLRATGGRITLDGHDLTGLPAHRRARAGVALVPQGRRVFASLTVAQHLAIAARRPPGDGPAHWDAERVRHLLPQLNARLHHRGHTLSGGEQQLLAIARALLAHPRLLLLDEPTEGLAPRLREQIHTLVTALARRGLAILLTASQPDLALAVADHLTLLAAGHITTAGTGTVAGAATDRDALARALNPTPVAQPTALVPPPDPQRPHWADTLRHHPSVPQADHSGGPS